MTKFSFASFTKDDFGGKNLLIRFNRSKYNEIFM